MSADGSVVRMLGVDRHSLAALESAAWEQGPTAGFNAAECFELGQEIR